jgi:acyl-CoA thioesterase FadM
LGFFRDHGWSDRLSFDAVRQNPDAVARAMADAARSASLLVALDGENPWEASPDAGAALRAALRRHLGNRRLTLDAWADEPPVGRIRRLHTGSWVDATLGIWYGDAEDRRLWRALRRVRDALAVAGPHLRVAEGSDWTWWTGAEFDTPFRADYEDLFRSRLEAASQALRSDPPESWRALSVPGGSMAASGGAFRWGRDALGRLWVDGTGWLREGASVRPLSGARPLTEVTPCEVATDPDGPWARVPADQGAVVHRHVVRLREVDAAGIAFFGRIFEIAHDAWEAVVREAGHPMATITSSAPWRLPLVHASADFASPLRLGDEIDVTVRLTTVGVSSVALHFELHRGAVLLATVHTVHVCVDAQSFASRPLDGEFLAGLRRVLP